MASKFRRFTSRRRFPRRPVMREKYAWSTTVFNDTALSQTGVVDEQVLWDPNVDEVGYPQMNTVWTIKRILGRGNVVYNLEAAATTTDLIGVWQCLYVIDREDTDSTIISSGAGTIFETERVLQVETEGLLLFEATVDPATVTVVTPRPRVDIDWKGSLKLRQDQLLIHAIQVGNDASAVLNDARLFATYRVLHVRNG